MKKRFFSMLLTAAMIASTLTVPAFAAPFGDTDGHWGQKAIERWSDHNIVNGADGMFRPDDSLTRGELATIVANLLKLTEMPAGNPFSDLDQNWYTNAILKCYEAGIMSGDGATVRPNDPVTREEAMVILSNALRIAPKEGEVEGFVDGHHVSDWAEGAVNALLHSGVVSGIGGDMLAPQGLINRASVVTILNNAIGNYVSEDGTTIEAKGGMVLVVGGDVTVTGEADSVVVLGGEKEVVLKDLEVKGDVVVEGADTKIVLSGETEVDKVTVAENATGAAVEVGADASAGEVAVEAPKAEVTVAGKADSVTVKGEETKVEVSGKVDVVAVGEAATDTEVTVTEDAKVDTLATDAANTDVLVQGKVSDVKVGDAAAETTVKVESTGEIETVETKAEDVSVSGKGEVGKVEASGDNTAVTTPDTKVEAAEGTSGVTAGDNKVEGGETATTTPEKEESGSSSSSSSHSHRYSTIWVDEETGVEYKKCSCGRKVATGNEYEAECNGTYFENLEDAVNAVLENGGTVMMLKDVELENGLVFNGEDSILLDMNGKKLSATATQASTALIRAEGTVELTINGYGTVDSASQGNDFNIAVWAKENAVITIEDGTFTNVGGKDFEDDGTTPNNNELIYVSGSGKIIIEDDPVFKGNVENETYGAKFTLNLQDNCVGSIEVSGGTFYGFNPAEAYTEPAPQPWNFVAEGYEATEDNDVWTVEAAKIDTEAELREAVKKGGKVVLEDEIELTETLTIEAGNTVTLDLNGYTISQTKECTDSYSMIANNGDLTITGNGTLSFEDTGEGDPGVGWASYTIRNAGTLVVENGTIEHLGQQTYNGNNAIFNYSGSTTIEDGKIEAAYSRSVRLWNGSVTIEGGTFDGQVWVQAMSDCSLTITDGSFKPATHGNDGSSVFVTNDTHTVTLNVTGGEFATKIGTSAPSKEGVVDSITGGTFSESAQTNTDSALIADGYEFVDGKVVAKATPAAEPAQDEPTTGEPEQDEPTTDEPTTGEPEQDEPTAE